VPPTIFHFFNTDRGKTMKATITETGDFTRQAEVEAIAAQPGSYRLQFNSQLASSRVPTAWQRNFALVLQKHELTALRDLIDAAL